MDSDAAKELKELRKQSRLKRLLADAELEKNALREVAKQNSEPSCKRRAVDMLVKTGRVEPVGVQDCWACPIHLQSHPDRPTPPTRTPICGLVAHLRHQTPRL
jgi:hypothetical protein